MNNNYLTRKGQEKYIYRVMPQSRTVLATISSSFLLENWVDMGLRIYIHPDHINSAVFFWYLLKSDLSSVCHSIVPYTIVTLYKVPEQHRHVHLGRVVFHGECQFTHYFYLHMRKFTYVLIWRYCTHVRWTSNFLQGTRNTRPCITSHSVPHP